MKDPGRRHTQRAEVLVVVFAWLACEQESPRVQGDDDDGGGGSEPASSAETGDVTASETGTPVEDTGPEAPWWDPESPVEGAWSGSCALVEGEDTLPDLWFELQLHGRLEFVSGGGRFGYTVSYGGGSTGTGGGGTSATTEVPIDVPIDVEGSLVDGAVSLEVRASGQRLPLDLTGPAPAADVLPLTVTDGYSGSRYGCDLALVP